jgi:hypothetical protein
VFLLEGRPATLLQLSSDRGCKRASKAQISRGDKGDDHNSLSLVVRTAPRGQIDAHPVEDRRDGVDREVSVVSPPRGLSNCPEQRPSLTSTFKEETKRQCS